MDNVVYLDNAATSFPKPECVLDAVLKYMRLSCANPGRSAHKLALRSSEAVYNAREIIAELIGVTKPENIIFTSSATHGLNLVIKGIITEGAHYIISNREHNAVIRPLLKEISRYGITVSVFENSGDVEGKIESQITSNTKAIIVSLVSNVTGDEIDEKALSDIKKKHNIHLIIDASQAIGHKPIDVRNLDCDALVAPGHKALFGLQGVGFVYLKDDFLSKTLIEGGNGYETFSYDMGNILPEKYEAGTLPTPSIVGLSRGIEYISSIGIDNVNRKLSTLTSKAKDILSSFDSIRILGAENGIISFNYKDYPSNFISRLLDKHGIALRSGYHCAPLIHDYMNTKNQGAVRISLSYLNKERDLDALYKAMKNELKTI